MTAIAELGLGIAGLRHGVAKHDLPEGHQLTDDDVYLAIPLHKGQLSCRELMNGELLLQPVKADRAIRIDDIENPYSQIPSLRKTIYARGMAAPVEPWPSSTRLIASI